MDRITLMLIIIFLVAACSDNRQVPQGEESDLQTMVASTLQADPQKPTATNILQPSVSTSTEDVLTPSLPVTATPPASVPLPLPTPLSSDFFSSPIQFDINGTYKDIVVDAIPAGGTKAFSLNTLKGQVMSISAWRQDGGESYIPQTQIIGADGNILCPSIDQQCKFWRGVLPSTQKYFVIFTADPNWEAASFMMRVAVNPPGVNQQYFQYRNASSGISLTYNDAFSPTGAFLDGYITTGNYKIQPDLILHLIDTKAFGNTNLSAVYMTIGSTNDSQIISTCLDAEWNGLTEQVMGTETFNGYEFFHTKRGGVAAGHYGEQEIYRMVYNNVCYEVIYHIHSVDSGSYPSGTVIEFDRNAIIQELDDVFSSFKIR